MSHFDPDNIKLEFKFYHIIAILFVFFFVISNLLAIKVSKIWIFDIPAGTITFPLSYVFSDILTEVYGFQRARQLVWIAVFCNAAFVFFAYIAIQLPVAPGWAVQQRDFAGVFGFEPRILLASSISYFVGDYINCSVLAKLKLVTQNKFIWFRFIGSTATGVAFDNLLFSIIAFIGNVPFHELMWLALGQYLFKVSYESIMSPFSVKISKWLKRLEETDIYDFNTRFSPFDFKIKYSAANNRYGKDQKNQEQMDIPIANDI